MKKIESDNEGNNKRICLNIYFCKIKYDDANNYIIKQARYDQLAKHDHKIKSPITEHLDDTFPDKPFLNHTINPSLTFSIKDAG